MEDLYFRQIEIGQMANYIYLIGSVSKREMVVVDPAWNIQGILDFAEQEEMAITGVLVSHTHPDHVGGDLFGHKIEGVEDLLEQCKAKVYVHKAEADRFTVPNSELVKTDDQSSLTVGEVKIDFMHTPGHTPGSQCFKLSDRLVSGDTLFIGSCGRVDLPGSSPEDLYFSLTQKLMKLDDETLVFPGHNYTQGMTHSRIDLEKEHNPFFQFSSKTEFLRAMGYG